VAFLVCSGAGSGLLFQFRQVKSRNVEFEHRFALVEHGGRYPDFFRLLHLCQESAVKSDFVKMMTRPCKPEKPIWFGKKKPLGLDGPEALQIEQALSCVGFEKMTPLFAPPNELTSAANEAAMNKGRPVGQADDERQTAPALAIKDIAFCNEFKRGQPCRFILAANACVESVSHARYRRWPASGVR
jgi:hypothetical protein